MGLVTPQFVEYNDTLALVLKQYPETDKNDNEVDTRYDLYVFASPSYILRGVNGLTLFGSPVLSYEVDNYVNESDD